MFTGSGLILYPGAYGISSKQHLANCNIENYYFMG